jgi:hypothetical protein
MTIGIHVASVGMIPFTKHGKRAIYSEMGEQAARAGSPMQASTTREYSRLTLVMYMVIQPPVTAR